MSNNGTHKTSGTDNTRIGERVDLDRRIDPLLESWLDQALAPDDVPVDLNDRVMVAVRRTLNEPEVAGRVDGGSRTWMLRIAAAIALMAIVGVAYMVYNSGDETGVNDQSPKIAGTGDDAATEDPLQKEFEELVEWLPEQEYALADEFDALDQEMEAFTATMNWSDDAWEDVEEWLDSAANEL